MNKPLISLAAFLALSAGAAGAAVPPAGAQFPEAQTSSRPAPLLLAERDFSRTTVINRNGKTGERHVSGGYDAEARTRHREVEGTTVNGRHYSGESGTTRTDQGWVHSGSQTGPNGGTRSREVEATVDRDTGTVTRDVSVTGPNGETRERTTVTHVERGR